jgi:hypothetical protein
MLGMMLLLDLTGCERVCCCDCFGSPLRPDEELAHRSLVFVGEVTWIDRDHEDFVAALRVEEAFAGTVPGLTHLMTSRSPCAVPLHDGERLLLFNELGSPALTPCMPILRLGVGATYEYCASPEDAPDTAVNAGGCPTPLLEQHMTEDEVLGILRAEVQ